MRHEGVEAANAELFEDRDECEPSSMIRRKESKGEEPCDDASEYDAQREEQPTPAKPDKSKAGELSEKVDEIRGAVAKVGENGENENDQHTIERECSS